MIRIYSAAATAVLCSLINVGCDSDAKQAFKGKTDGATNAGGSDSAAGGAAGSDSAAGGTSHGGASGDGSVAPGACGTVFGHTGACKTCLEAHCCDQGKACSSVANCPELAQCIRDCDSKGGTQACVTTCNDKYLTGDSRVAYNPLTICMGQSCLSECPFHGP